MTINFLEEAKGVRSMSRLTLAGWLVLLLLSAIVLCVAAFTVSDQHWQHLVEYANWVAKVGIPAAGVYGINRAGSAIEAAKGGS